MKFSDFVPIIVAFITAAGAIVVAIINKSKPKEERPKEEGRAPAAELSAPPHEPATSLAVNNQTSPVKASKRRGRRLKSTMWVLIAVSVLSAGLFAWNFRSREFENRPELKITVPRDGASVEQRQMVRGTSRALPQGTAIWVVVYPQKVGMYYPQNEPAVVQSDGQWSALCDIGVEENVGQKFDIIAVLADKRGQAAFSNYLSDAREKRSWAGRATLPEGVTIHDRIQVERR